MQRQRVWCRRWVLLSLGTHCFGWLCVEAISGASAISSSYIFILVAGTHRCGGCLHTVRAISITAQTNTNRHTNRRQTEIAATHTREHICALCLRLTRNAHRMTDRYTIADCCVYVQSEACHYSSRLLKIVEHKTCCGNNIYCCRLFPLHYPFVRVYGVFACALRLCTYNVYAHHHHHHCICRDSSNTYRHTQAVTYTDKHIYFALLSNPTTTYILSTLAQEGDRWIFTVVKFCVWLQLAVCCCWCTSLAYGRIVYSVVRQSSI